MSVRLPLQTGAGALRDFIVSASSGGALIALGAWASVFGFSNFGRIDVEHVTISLVGLAILGLGLATGIGAYISGANHRASDVLVGEHGLAIEGGRKHGIAVGWKELDPAKCTLEDSTTTAVRGPGTTRYDHALFVSIAGDPVLLAETSEEEERASVEALLDVIRARTGPKARPTAPADSLACRQCGAPAPLADAQVVPCPYCRAPVEVPGELRQRLQQASALDAASGALADKLQRVLHQPGALGVNLMSGVTAMLAYVAAGAAVLAPFASAARGAIAPLACAAACAFFFTRASIAGRRALRQVLLGFGARAAPDGSHACARCSGGLPTTVRAGVVRCVYCACHNVLGIDFGARAQHVHGGHAEIGEVLAKRARARATHVVLGVSALALGITLPVAWRLSLP